MLFRGDENGILRGDHDQVLDANEGDQGVVAVREAAAGFFHDHFAVPKGRVAKVVLLQKIPHSGPRADVTPGRVERNAADVFRLLGDGVVEGRGEYRRSSKNVRY